MPALFSGKQFEFHNPDGGTIAVRGWGNQFHAVFETLDGYTVVKNPADQFYEYAVLSADGADLVPSGVRVGSPELRPAELAPHLRVRPGMAKARALQAMAQQPGRPRWQVRREEARMETRRRALQSAAITAPPGRFTVGNYVGLCLLIEFPDVPRAIAREEVQSFCNQAGYSNFGNNGSVHDYFFDVSAGRVRYTNIVTAYYTARQNRAYYTDPSVSYGTRARELIREALDELARGGFDFSGLSTDDGGFVFALNAFYAGPVTNNWAEGLWPHAWTLETPFETAAGNRLADYQIANIGAQLTLGTFCHENGHMLCDFPDLYDYGGESAGIGAYCLMCNGASETNPIHVCAYLKYRAGWATEVTSITPGLNATVTAGSNALFLHQRSASEYFIIENRQRLGRDAALPDHGLAIWHVDELGSNQNEQMLPGQHYECSIEQADGRFDLERNRNGGDQDDLFAAPERTRFGDATTPSSRWWDGTPSGLEIQQISASASSMTFTTATGSSTWSGWFTQGGLVTSDIALALNSDGRLEAFVRGPSNALWHLWQLTPGGSWSSWRSEGGVLASNVAVARNADGRLEAFMRGTDNALWHKWQLSAGGSWSDWRSEGGVLTGDVAVAQNANGGLEVFARRPDGALVHRWQVSPGGNWSDWASEGGALTSNVAVARNADGRLEVFARGPDGTLWHNWQSSPNGTWAGWASEGGVLLGDVSVGQNADGRLEVFMRGTDNALWHKWQVAPNGTWSSWASLGGAFVSEVAVERNADGRLEAFVRGTDSALWHKWQLSPGGAWSDWKSEGGALSGNVAVGKNADGRLEVFAAGTDGTLLHNWQTTTAAPVATANKPAPVPGNARPVAFAPSASP